MIGMLAIAAFALCIVWYLLLDRDAGRQLSLALWIPTIWMLINSSRSVSDWLQREQPSSLAQRYAEGSPLDAAIYALLILAGALVLNFRASKMRAFLRNNLPLILFLAYCALSTLWADYPFISMKRWIKAAGDVIMIALLFTDRFPISAILRVFIRVGIVLLPLSVVLIYFFPSLGTVYDVEDMVTYYCGVTTFKNLLGMVCMVYGLLALWSFLVAFEARSTPRRLTHLTISATVALVACALIIKADSMTSFGSFVLASGLLIALSRNTVARAPGSVHILTSATIAIPLLALFVSTMGAVLQSVGRNATLTGRTAIWKAVLAQHTNPLIGTGYESFWMGDRLQTIWTLSVHGIQEAHNGYLEVYLNLGLIGLSLLGFIAVRGYQNAVAVYRRDRMAGCLRIACFAAGIMYSLTEAGFHMMSPVWLMFLIACAGSPSDSLLLAEEQQQQLELRRPPRATALKVLY